MFDSTLTLLKLHRFYGYIMARNRNKKIQGDILGSSALACSGSVLELSGTGSVQYGTVPGLFSQSPAFQDERS